jgi:hypothetical protein
MASSAVPPSPPAATRIDVHAKPARVGGTGDGAPELPEPPATVAAKAAAIADELARAKHAIIFTGAGISTASGIPDFRGPKGKWTRQGE